MLLSLLLLPVRFAVIEQLAHADTRTFSELLKATNTTPGNLGAHLHKLVAAGFLIARRRFVARRPQTRYQLTSTGRAALAAHSALLNSPA